MTSLMPPLAPGLSVCTNGQQHSIDQSIDSVIRKHSPLPHHEHNNNEVVAPVNMAQPLQPLMCSSPADDTRIETGAKFSSYEHFERCFDDWKAAYFHPFRVASSETLKNPDGTTNDTFKYRYIVFHCAHYGKPRMRGAGKRPNQNYMPCDCRAMLRLNYSWSDNALRITTLNDQHQNHELSAETYERFTSKLRRVSPQLNTSALSSGSQPSPIQNISPCVDQKPLLHQTPVQRQSRKRSRHFNDGENGAPSPAALSRVSTGTTRRAFGSPLNSNHRPMPNADTKPVIQVPQPHKPMPMNPLLPALLRTPMFSNMHASFMQNASLMAAMCQQQQGSIALQQQQASETPIDLSQHAKKPSPTTTTNNNNIKSDNTNDTTELKCSMPFAMAGGGAFRTPAANDGSNKAAVKVDESLGDLREYLFASPDVDQKIQQLHQLLGDWKRRST